MASEQYFSAVSDMYANRKRNRIEPTTAKALLFLSKNLPLINYQYNFRKLSNDVCDSDKVELSGDAHSDVIDAHADPLL